MRTYIDGRLCVGGVIKTEREIDRSSQVEFEVFSSHNLLTMHNCLTFFDFPCILIQKEESVIVIKL